VSEILLALDTSTSSASIALVTIEPERETLAELTWNVGRRHSTELLTRLEWLLAASGVATGQLSGVAVATGPGSFNGLRVALATAKSLALARHLPLYGVPTLDVIGWGAEGFAATVAAGPVWALLEAGRGQVYAACYIGPDDSAAEWGPSTGYAVLTPKEVAHRVGDGERALFAGEWGPETRAALETELGERARFASPLRARRAVWLAELALARTAAGQHDDPATLEPLYLRRPAITTSTKVGLAPPTTPTAPLARTTASAGTEGPPAGREEARHALRG
jgi:tRNA threonylcarbamoyladenosine biosynthesis protein TsaB